MTDFWPLEPLWPKETVFLLGGGPSLRCVDLGLLRSRRVLAINSSAKLAPWADALFFTDQPWLDKHGELVAQWPKLVFTLSFPPVRNLPPNVKQVSALKMDPLFEGGSIKRGQSSGHTAIGLAASLGASRIVLLGYDMRFVAGRSHCHDDHTSPDENIYADVFIPAFKGWNEAAKLSGVEVFNATPGSALKEFPAVEFEEIWST